MAKDIDINVRVNESDAKAAFNNLNIQSQKLEQEIKELDNSVKKLTKDFGSQAFTIPEVKKEMTGLLTQIDTKKAALKGLTQEMNTMGGALDKVGNKAQQTKDQFKNFGMSVQKLAGTLGIAFGAYQLFQFGKEAVILAAKLEGVKIAFDRLNKPDLLANLRKATRNTVTDLELMQVSMRASNFKIPLDQLATLLSFAQKRASQTGESVDYLVKSIVDGIGRKSTLVLDNLGISAVELQEEIKKVGDFAIATGNIVTRELGKMGDVAETTADKIAQVNTIWENFKTEAGGAIVDVTYFLKQQIDAINELDEVVSKFVFKFLGFDWPVATTGLNDFRDLTNKLLRETRGKKFIDAGETVGEVQKIKNEIAKLQAQIEDPDAILSVKELHNLLRQVAKLELKLKIDDTSIKISLKELKKALEEAWDWLARPQIERKKEAPIPFFIETSKEIKKPVLLTPEFMEETRKRLEEENRFYIDLIKSSADVLRFEFISAWEDIFGKANSLLEKLIANFASQLLSLGAQKLAFSLLSFIPGFSVIAGAASAIPGANLPAMPGTSPARYNERPQVIIVRLGDTDLGSAIIKGDKVIQRRRLI